MRPSYPLKVGFDCDDRREVFLAMATSNVRNKLKLTPFAFGGIEMLFRLGFPVSQDNLRRSENVIPPIKIINKNAKLKRLLLRLEAKY